MDQSSSIIQDEEIDRSKSSKLSVVCSLRWKKVFKKNLLLLPKSSWWWRMEKVSLKIKMYKIVIYCTIAKIVLLSCYY